MKKKVPLPVVLLAWIAVLAAAAAACAAAVWLRLSAPATAEGEPERELELRVAPGDSVMHVARGLEEAGIIRSARALYLAARFNVFQTHEAFSLKAGRYVLRSSMTLEEVSALVQEGIQESVSCSIPEGLTRSKIARLLEEAGVCPAADFMAASGNRELLDEYGIPGDSFEGYLFPDTYYFALGMGGEAAVRKLADTFFERVSSIEQLRALDSRQLYGAVILASIVEREYQVAEEAPLIASVFANRLRAGMGLESCATVEYIITEVQGRPHPDRIFYSDLEIDSPYNTYKWRSLPPGPISSPGMVSLRAAAAPADTDYFYFVLKDPGGGRHTFSHTLDEHNRASRQLYTKRAAGR